MKIAVIGGGAAGFIAAITAKELNPQSRVNIFEKTEQALSKVKISGGGRCNVTNATFGIARLIKNYPRGGSQLRKSFNLFNVKHTVQWFESRGIALKIEADKRMFPSSNNSHTIVNLLLETTNELGINISYKSKVRDIAHSEKGVELSVNNELLSFNRVIIATGGTPKANGFDWLTVLGYRISLPIPSLFTFNMPKDPITDLMGVSVPNVVASIKGSNFKQSGPLLITHWGMSGPAILKLSAFAARYLLSLIHISEPTRPY